MFPIKYELTRPGTVLPWLAFLCFGLIYMTQTEHAVMFVLFAIISFGSGFLLWRGFRVCVVLTESDITIRTTWRTTHLPWDWIAHAELRPMRTASPLRSILSYPALSLRLRDGTVRQFDDISAPPEESRRVSDIADHINSWLERQARAT